MKPFITAEWNEQFIGVAFYCGYFKDEGTFEAVLQIGWLEVAIGLEMG